MAHQSSTGARAAGGLTSGLSWQRAMASSVRRREPPRSVLRDEGCSAEVEQIVRPDFEDMHSRRRAGGNRYTDKGSCAYVQELRTEIQIIVFELDGPIARQRMLDTGADEKTVQIVASRCESRCSETAIQRGIIVERTPHPTALAVDQRTVKGDTGTAGDAEIAGVLGGQADAVKGHKGIDDHGIGRLAVRPGPFALDTEHPIAGLIVTTYLTAGDRAGPVVARAARAFEIGGRKRVDLRAANVGTDVTSGPAERRRRCDRSFDR